MILCLKVEIEACHLFYMGVRAPHFLTFLGEQNAALLFLRAVACHRRACPAPRALPCAAPCAPHPAPRALRPAPAAAASHAPLRPQHFKINAIVLPESLYCPTRGSWFILRQRDDSHAHAQVRKFLRKAGM